MKEDNNLIKYIAKVSYGLKEPLIESLIREDKQEITSAEKFKVVKAILDNHHANASCYHGMVLKPIEYFVQLHPNTLEVASMDKLRILSLDKATEEKNLYQNLVDSIAPYVEISQIRCTFRASSKINNHYVDFDCRENVVMFMKAIKSNIEKGFISLNDLEYRQNFRVDMLSSLFIIDELASKIKEEFVSYEHALNYTNTCRQIICDCAQASAYIYEKINHKGLFNLFDYLNKNANHVEAVIKLVVSRNQLNPEELNILAINYPPEVPTKFKDKIKDILKDNISLYALCHKEFRTVEIGLDLLNFDVKVNTILS